LAVLALALIVTVALDPLVILSPAFWLSYLAVAILFTCLAQAPNRAPSSSSPSPSNMVIGTMRRLYISAARPQLLLSVGLALPGLWFFSQVSLVSPVANFVAVPLFAFWILPSTLVGLVLLGLHPLAAQFCLEVAGAGLAYLMAMLTWLTGMPRIIWQPPDLNIVGLVTVICGVVCLLLPHPLPSRVPGLILVFWAFSAGGSAAPATLAVSFLDVGQGLAVLVRTRNHSMLYDAGGKWPGGNAGQSVVVPVLRSKGVDALDLMVISHSDSDHSGGSIAVLDAINVAARMAPRPEKNWFVCRRGLKWTWDNVNFSVLHPNDQSIWSDNNGSCVLLVRAGGSVLLLTGDIEADAEIKLVSQYDLSNVALLTAPHHGSRTSSTRSFVDSFNSPTVVFSVGYQNRWNFPDLQVLQRWDDSGGCAMTTAISGGLEFSALQAGGFELIGTGRDSYMRPWSLRNQQADACLSTINAGDSGV